MKTVSLTFWHNNEEPTKHGYTPADEDDKAKLRLGPLVIAWELF